MGIAQHCVCYLYLCKAAYDMIFCCYNASVQQIGSEIDLNHC